MWNIGTLWHQVLPMKVGDGIMAPGYQWLAHFNKGKWDGYPLLKWDIALWDSFKHPRERKKLQYCVWKTIGHELIVLSDGLIKVPYPRLTRVYLKHFMSKFVFKLLDMSRSKRLGECTLCLFYILKTQNASNKTFWVSTFYHKWKILPDWFITKLHNKSAQN